MTSGMVTRSRARRAAVAAPRDSGMGTLKTTTTTTTKKKRVSAATAPVSAGIQKTKEAAGASEEAAAGAGQTLSEATEILKLKKEAFGATRLWKEVCVPGALERWLKARAEEARAEEALPKKTRMVRRTKLPKALIETMKRQPYCSTEPRSDEELAKQTESSRELYALVRFVDDKMNAYEQALIKQYDSRGYAEDETEVTCD